MLSFMKVYTCLEEFDSVWFEACGACSSPCGEEHNDIHDVKKEQELRQQKEEQEKRHKLLRPGRLKCIHDLQKGTRVETEKP